MTKQLLETEEKYSAVTKERDTIQSQKNAAEARLKVLQGNIKSTEKVKDKIGSILLEKDQYITKLEVENKSLESEIAQERMTSARKLEEINGTLKELTKAVKLKDTEILNLRDLSNQAQAENQKLMKTLVEKEKDIGVATMRANEAERVYNGLLFEFEDKLKKKVDEKFGHVMVYLDEKQSEIDRLRTLLDEKKLESEYISENEGQKLKDMEDVVYNLAKELREKDQENENLRKFIEEYQNVFQQVN